MDEIILHQYELSPYSEKVRIVLAIKGLAYRRCMPPVVAPKPLLTALTGGYRRIPVLQIGADIFCDSELIIRTLDRLFPDPPLHCAGGNAMDFALAPWFERLLTDTMVPLAFRNVPEVDPAFVRDRELVMERKFVDLPAWRAIAPHAGETLRAQLGWMDDQLSDGRDWLNGKAPGLLDVFAAPNLSFLRQMGADTALIDALPRVTGWLERIQVLKGKLSPEIGAQEALEIARSTVPAMAGSVDSGEPNGLREGDRVTIRAADYGREAVDGVIVAASAQEIAIHRTDPLAGDVVVHFPRTGFHIIPAKLGGV